jgi:hypothetical protein
MIQEEGLKLMVVDEGADHNIRCRFISRWFKIDSYVSNKGMLLLEIEKVDPDVVLADLEVYAKLDGISITILIVSYPPVSPSFPSR